jgi:pimeloyl-ACP methyl ester carboxylesterase
MAPFLAYEDKGGAADAAALPLVLIHGHPFDHTMWTPQIAAFSSRRRVIAPDLRGYGASPVIPGVTPLATFAEDIAALLDHLGVDRFILAGLSMGGQIAMECYRLFPERIRGLVLADTFPSAETPEGRKARAAMADRLLREGMAGYADEVLYKMVAPYADARVAAHVRRMMTATPPEGAAAALRGRAERPDYRRRGRRRRVHPGAGRGGDARGAAALDAQRDRLGGPFAEPGATGRVQRGAGGLPGRTRRLSRRPARR